MNRVVRLTFATCAAACSSVLVGSGIAAAHIDSDPAAVAAGSAATVGFGVEHGCDGSNTSAVQIKIPDSVTDAKPVDKAGWTTTATDDTVTFTGGDLDAETADTFAITFTAPATPGTIYFPIVQTCVVGETAWIEIPVAGATEPEHPAPALLITDGPPTSADLAPADDDTAATEDGTVAPEDADDASNTGTVIAIVAGVVVVLGGAAVVAVKRKNH